MDVNLDHIERLIVHECITGKGKEVLFPAIMEFVNENVFKDEAFLFMLQSQSRFYSDNKKVGGLKELKIFVDTDEKKSLFLKYVEDYKSMKDSMVDKTVLLKYTEEFLRQRLVKSLLREAYAKDANGEEVDLQTVYAKIEEAMGIYLQDDLGLSIFQNSEEYIEYLKNEESFISTGFPWLDRQLGGGFVSSGSAMYNFCASSNVGKSNLIKSIACNLSEQGKKGLVISLEMPRNIYADRFVSELSGIGISNLKEEALNAEMFIKTKSGEYGDIVIKDFATGSLTTQQLSSYIKRAEQHWGGKFDCVFIDYPELLKPTTKFSGNRHDLVVASLYIECRALSFYHEVPVVVVSQLNRSGYNDEEPNMSNIGNSIGIVQCSDYMGFMFASKEMKAVNQFRLSTGKNRFNRVGDSQMFDVNPVTLSIDEASRDMTIIDDEDEEIVDDSDDDIWKTLMNNE